MPLLPSSFTLPRWNDPFSEDAQYYLGSKIQGDFYVNQFAERINKYYIEQKEAKAPGSFKVYYSAPFSKLIPNLRLFRNVNWERVVLKRESTRAFNNLPITFAQLSNLLVLSCGLKADGKWMREIKAPETWPRRALPSGGAIYPLECYVLAREVTGLRSGLYHFCVSRGGLSLLRADKDLFSMKDYWYQEDHFKSPAALLFFSAVFQRTRVKYGSRALRYILMELGGIGTHMNLTSSVMGVDFCWDGGGFESKIESLIGIDGRKEGLVGMCALGHTSK